MNTNPLRIAGLTAVTTTCLASLSLNAAAEPTRPFVVGHRGLIHSAPECTLAAFRACLALRLGFEFDVRRTKDGALVCLHDATLDRTTDGQGNVHDLTLSELRKFDAGIRFDPTFRGERIPSIDEIFQLIAKEPPGDSLFAVDLKDTGDGLEEHLVRLAEKHGILNQLLFIGSTIDLPAVRERLKTASKLARTARLVTASTEITTNAEIKAALADPNTDWLYLRHFPTDADLAQIRAAQKPTFLAGPLVAGQEPENWSRATTLGLHALLTDYPLDLAHQLRKAATTGRVPLK